METLKINHTMQFIAHIFSYFRKDVCVTAGISFLLFFIFLPMRDIQAQDYQEERDEMVRTQIEARGIKSQIVLEAMQKVPRHLFVPEKLKPDAYTDRPLSIGHEQTISQPFIVGFMSESLAAEPGDKVLEIGTGSGYQAAVLAEMGLEVWSIEIIPELAEQAKENLEKAGYQNVNVKEGNGYQGWPEEAPFDAVIITAAPESIPDALVEQLRTGGVMVLPVGSLHTVQSLKKVEKKEEGITQSTLLPVRFVPMVKEYH